MMKQEKPEIKMIEPSTLALWPSPEQMQASIDATLRALQVPAHLLGIEPPQKQSP